MPRKHLPKVKKCCRCTHNKHSSLTLPEHSSHYHQPCFPFRIDQPTGETPIRQTYQYPRELVRTASHDDILRQFREASVAKELSAFASFTTESVPTVTSAGMLFHWYYYCLLLFWNEIRPLHPSTCSR